jgi:uncharacterized LabA/DUF88 family protein
MRIGIYIDAPNMLGMIRSLKRRIDIDKLLLHLNTKKRSIRLKKVFFDRNPDKPNQSFESFIGLLYHKGFNVYPVELKRYGQNGENGYKSRTDWELAFAILNDVAENNIDVVILISGDSDYKKVIEICKKIKPRLKVEVYATRNTLSYELKNRKLIDDFFFFEELPELLMTKEQIAA